MKYFKKLVGERIYLSPRNLEDYEKFVQWLNDFNTTDYIGRSSAIVTIEGEQEYLRINKGDVVNFAIVTMDNDEMIGSCSLESIDYIKRIGTLGILIGDEENRNKGYGTEAIRLLLDYGFNYLNLNNIMLQLMEFNKRAFECYKKCGFKEMGRRRKCDFVNGKYYDSIQMDIIAEEFTESYIKNKNSY